MKNEHEAVVADRDAKQKKLEAKKNTPVKKKIVKKKSDKMDDSREILKAEIIRQISRDMNLTANGAGSPLSKTITYGNPRITIEMPSEGKATPDLENLGSIEFNRFNTANDGDK